MGYHFLLQQIFLIQGSLVSPALAGGFFSTVLCLVVSYSEQPKNCSLSGSSALGILQARILEWVAIPFSRESSQPRDQTQVPCIVGSISLCFKDYAKTHTHTKKCSFPLGKVSPKQALFSANHLFYLHKPKNIL